MNAPARPLSDVMTMTSILFSPGGGARGAARAAAQQASRPDQLGEDVPEGPRLEDRPLRFSELGRRDGLHRLGDLLRVLDAFDPAAKIDEGRHATSGPP